LGSIGYWAILLLAVIPISILLGHLDASCQQIIAGKLGRGQSKAIVLANEGTHNEIQQ